MPKIQVNGLEMNYSEFGSDNEGTPIVLVHGLGSQAKWFEPLANYLAINCNSHVFAIDLPGFGLSDKPETESYSISSFVKYIAAWLDAVNLDKVIILGHSLGGMIAQLLAKEHSSRVEKMILLCAATYLRASGIELAMGKLLSLKATAAVVMKRAFPKDYPKEKIDETIKEVVANTSKSIYLKSLMAMTKKNFDSTAWLPELRVPTLIIGSENDRSLGYDMSKVLSEKIPGSVLYTIRNGNHEAETLHTEEVGTAIGKFITS
ncbi:MAG TPA: alpha/beta hydrolase [Candidatus Lokiarchaeia archaeon]|nr:alpha/beta hydrolase [Candidatus Lokiarchaeia archaeon]